MTDWAVMRFGVGLALMLGLGVLSGCTQDTLEVMAVTNRQEAPLPSKMQQKLRKLNISTSSPIMMRLYKEEAVMEIWKADNANRYQLVATYPICAWSGQLGPKKKEGDRQAPEGFYTVAQHQMNPNSSYYLSFDIGYPNKYDRAYGRSGSNLMVHGACSSAGCYSMSDAAVLQIYAFARDAFRGGQKAFQVQAFPFRMTADNMAKHRFSPNYPFWENLKVGYDQFEITKRPPEVDVCEKKYVFNQAGSGKLSATGKCPADSTPPALASAYAAYQKQYQAAFATASAKWGKDDWTDIPEFTRKAQERLARRKGIQNEVPNDAKYVIVDPTAKITPTSDTVTSYSAAYQKVEDYKNKVPPKVEYISVAELEARKKAEEEQLKEQEKLDKKLAHARIPVPEANPLRPVQPAMTAESVKRDGDTKGKPLWSFWFKKSQPDSEQASMEPQVPATLPAEKTAKSATASGNGHENARQSVATASVPKAVAQPQDADVTQAEAPQQGKKPFWKLW